MNWPMTICLMITLSYIPIIEAQGCASNGAECRSPTRCCDPLATCLTNRNNGDDIKFCKVVQNYPGNEGNFPRGASCIDSRQCAQKCCRWIEGVGMATRFICGTKTFDYNPTAFHKCETLERP